MEEFGPGVDYYWEPKLKGTQINYLAAALPEKPPVFEYIALFEQETGIKVNLTVLSETDVFTKASTVFAAKSSEFDIVDAGWYGAAAYAYWKSGFITPIEDFLPITPKGFNPDDCVDAARKACTTFPEDGSKWLVWPICSTACMGLWHRTDIMQGTELPMPLPGTCTLEGEYVKGTPITWDEFKAAADKVHNPPKMTGYGMFNMPPVLAFYGWESFPWYFNKNFLHKDFTPNFDDPEVIEATKLFIEMSKYVPDPTTYDWATMIGQATAGTLANFATCSTDQADIFAKGAKVTHENCKYAWSPKVKVSSVMAAGSTPCISAFSNKKEAAWSFYSWLKSPRMEELFFLKGNSPGRKSIVASPKNKQLKDWNAQVGIQSTSWFEAAKIVGTPGAELVYCNIVPKMPRSIDLVVAVGTEIGKAYSKEISVEQAMKNSQEAATKILKEVDLYGNRTYEFGT
jgi:ABC-type glycerol-3-phosphate transport system substrate-binding protein